VKHHVCSCGCCAVRGASGETYIVNRIRGRKEKWVLPLTEMSTSREESDGENLITWGCRRFLAAYLPSTPALPPPSPEMAVAEAWVASSACTLKVVFMEFCLFSSSIISCTLISWPTWPNLCNSVFECSLEMFSASWVLADSVLGPSRPISLNGLLPQLCPVAVTADTVYVRGSKKKDPDPPYAIPSGSCRCCRTVLDIDIYLIIKSVLTKKKSEFIHFISSA